MLFNKDDYFLLLVLFNNDNCLLLLVLFNKDNCLLRIVLFNKIISIHTKLLKAQFFSYN